MLAGALATRIERVGRWEPISVSVGSRKAEGDERASAEGHLAILERFMNLANDEADRIQVAKGLFNDAHHELVIAFECVPQLGRRDSKASDVESWLRVVSVPAAMMPWMRLDHLSRAQAVALLLGENQRADEVVAEVLRRSSMSAVM